MRARVAVVGLAMMVTAGCTFVLRDPGVTVACGPLRFEINPGGAGESQIAAVVAGVERYGRAAGRPVVFLGETTATARADRGPRDPVLLEFFWPDDAPVRYGYAEPALADERYVGGFVYIHPMLEGAAEDLVTRLVMHELGHLAGLDDVDAGDELMNPDLTAGDWGPGDLWGLHLTHIGCRPAGD